MLRIQIGSIGPTDATLVIFNNNKGPHWKEYFIESEGWHILSRLHHRGVRSVKEGSLNHLIIQMIWDNLEADRSWTARCQ